MSGTPFMTRCLMRDPVTGCPSVGLAPVMRMQFVNSRSAMLLVAAPVPKAFCMPQAVGLWQTRAQASMLFVPKPTRMNFCIR